jgi:hypothetical protein
MTDELDEAVRGPEPEAPGPLWAIPILFAAAIAALALSWCTQR